MSELSKDALKKIGDSFGEIYAPLSKLAEMMLNVFKTSTADLKKCAADVKVVSGNVSKLTDNLKHNYLGAGNTEGIAPTLPTAAPTAVTPRPSSGPASQGPSQ